MNTITVTRDDVHAHDRTVPLTLLQPGQYQPRKRMDEAALQELAESVRAQGIMQPIIVRPIANGRYEIIAGERRSRAAKMAGLTMVPILVKDVSDQAAALMALIENIQREDLHVLEEAHGYDVLAHPPGEAQGLTPAEIGKQVGKDADHVRKRLKLARLIPQAQEALMAELITLGTAEEVARMPPTVQAEAFKKIMATQSAPDKPVKHRDATEILKKHFMLRLNGAVFPIKDETLVPEAGGCHTCPKRTGANPDLFADVPEADTCTDPACHATKVRAHNELCKQAARDDGLQVFEGDTARALLKFGENSTQLGGEYVYLDEGLLDLTGSTNSLNKLLGTLIKPSALFEHPKDLTLREIVHVVKATDVLREQGLLKNVPVDTPAARKAPKTEGTTVATAPDKSHEKPTTTERDEKAIAAEMKYQLAWRTEVFRAYHNALHNIGHGYPSGVRRMLAIDLALRALNNVDAMALMVELWGWELPKWPMSLRATLSGVVQDMNDDQLDLLIAELIVLPEVFVTESDLVDLKAHDLQLGYLELAANEPELEIDVKAIQASLSAPKAKKKAKAAGEKKQIYPTFSPPPASEHHRARGKKAGTPAQPQEDSSQQARGPEGDEGTAVVATEAALGQGGEEQQAQGPGHDDVAKASTISPDEAWPFPTGEKQFMHAEGATAPEDALPSANWVGQVVKVKGTKCVRTVFEISPQGVITVGVMNGTRKSSKTTHASSELLVLPDQVRPTATTKPKKGGK